jgi:ribosomal protein S18 acetylase RimI-like enzyme
MQLSMPRSGPSCVVRAARRADLPALKAIWLELMGMHERNDPSFALAKDALSRWQQMAEDMIDREDTFVLAALWQGQVSGFCLGWVARNPPIYQVSEVGFVSEIAVAQAAQRRGIGRALIEACRAWFKDRRLEEFQLSTAVWNEPARKFWEAQGGEPLLVRYRFDVVRDTAAR